LTKILLIEDDFQLGDVVMAFLEMNQLEVTLCETASDALEKIKTKPFDCIILDLNLPDEDGLVLLRKIRHFSNCPVIICSARGTTEERIAGLEFGAQDYLPKPYSTKELILRIKNLVKLSRQEHVNTPPKRKGIYYLDTDRKGLVKNDTDSFIKLTIAEFYLFKTLYNHEGRVYTRSELIDAVSNIDGPENDRAIDVSISRLRKKIEEDPENPKIIVTDRGFGYHLCNYSLK
jgi:DNA-binding response OmpR family regulator